MATETFINVGETTLAVAATNVATTFTLASGAPFNVTGQFRLRLDDSLQQGSGIATRYELCRATFNAGNVVNVFRTGVDLEGTTAQAWPIGTKVVAIVTAAGMANIVPHIAARAYRGAAYNTVSSMGTVIPYEAASYDLSGNFSTSTSLFTCPIAGYYDVFASTRFQAGANPFALLIWKNGVLQATGGDIYGTIYISVSTQVHDRFLCAPGDTIAILYIANVVTPMLTGASSTYAIFKFDGAP